MTRSVESHAILALALTCWGASCSAPEATNDHVTARVTLSAEVEKIEVTVDDEGEPRNLEIAAHGARAKDWVVEVSATREKNPEAQGSEVWLFDAEALEKKTDWTNATWVGTPWTERESTEAHSGRLLIAMSDRPQRVTLRLHGTGMLVRLLKHPWSGIAEVSVSGQTRKVDLYSATSGIEVLSFEDDATGPNEPIEFDLPRLQGSAERLRFKAQPGGHVRVESLEIGGRSVPILNGNEASWTRPPSVAVGVQCVWWGGLVVLLLFGGAVFFFPNNASSFRIGVLCAIAGLLVGGWWTLIAYPGYLSGDSLDQWGQAIRHRYTPWHPPLMSLLMHVSQLFTRVPALFTFVQASFFWFALFWATSVVIQNRRLWIIVAVLLAAHPVLWLYSTTLWKDVWVAGPTLIALGLTLGYSRSRSSGALWAASCFFALAICFRHNAITIVPVLLGVFAFCSKDQTVLRRLLIALALTFVMIAPSKLVNRLPVVDGSGSVGASDLLVPYYFALVARISPASADYAETKTAIETTFGEGTFERVRSQYTCACGLYLLYNGTALGSTSALAKNKAFIDRSFWKLARNHLPELAEHRVCSLEAFMQVPGLALPYFPYIVGNDLGLSDASWWPEARLASVAAADSASRGPLMRHYLFDVVLVLALALGVWRRRWVMVIVSLIGLSYLAPFFVVDPCPDWRYQFLNYLMSLLCIGALGDWVVASFLAPRR